MSENDNNDSSPLLHTKAKRDEYLVEIRRKKNLSHFQKIRTEYCENVNSEIPSILVEQNTPFIDNSQELQIQESNDPIQNDSSNQYHNQFASVLDTQSWDDLLPVVKNLRSLIRNQLVIESGRVIINPAIVPHLIGLLSARFGNYKDLQVEVAWLFANITASNSQDIPYLVEQNIIPTLRECLNRNYNGKLQEKAMWTLANICNEQELAYRDIVLNMDILNLIVKIIYTVPKEIQYYRNAAWFISNLVRGYPFPAYEKVAQAVNVLTHLLENNDPYVQEKSLLGLANLTESIKDSDIESASDRILIQKIVKLINNQTEHISLYALRIAGNMAQRNRNIKDSGIFEVMHTVLTHSNPEIRREGCITLSNILPIETNESEADNQQKFIPIFLAIAENDDEDENKALATSCLYSILVGKFQKDEEVIQIMPEEVLKSELFNYTKIMVDAPTEEEFVAVLFQNLTSTYATLVENSVDVLSIILKRGDRLKRYYNGYNYLACALAQKKLTQDIEHLLTHKNDNVRHKTSVLLDEFFGLD